MIAMIATTATIMTATITMSSRFVELGLLKVTCWVRLVVVRVTVPESWESGAV